MQSIFTYGNGSETLLAEDAVIHLQHTAVQIGEIEGGMAVQLIRTESGHLMFTQRLASQKYAVNIPTEAVFDPQWAPGLEKYFSSFSATGIPLGNLADLILFFRPTYGKAQYARPVPRPFFTSNDDPVQTHTLMSMAVTGNGGDGEMILATGDEPSVFLVNKPVFNQYLEKFFPTLPPERSILLLLVLDTMVDLSWAIPSLSRATKESVREAVDSWARQYHFNATPADLFDTIYANLADFFDFPLKMPALRPLVLAGQMRVRFTAGQEAVKVNFDLCTLTAEFEVATAGDGDKKLLVVRRYPWDPSTEISNRHVKFHFQDHPMLHEIRGDVRGRVKAFDGSDLYLESFRPFDPRLEGLDMPRPVRSLSTQPPEQDTLLPSTPFPILTEVGSPSSSQGTCPFGSTLGDPAFVCLSTTRCEDPNCSLSFLAGTDNKKSTDRLDHAPTQPNQNTTEHNPTLWACEQNPAAFLRSKLGADSGFSGFPSFLEPDFGSFHEPGFDPFHELDLDSFLELDLDSFLAPERGRSQVGPLLAPSPLSIPTPIHPTNTSITQQSLFAEYPGDLPDTPPNDSYSADSVKPTNSSSTPEQQRPYHCQTCGKRFPKKCDLTYV